MRYCLFHAFSGTNRGDAAIVLGLRAAIGEHDPEAQWVALPSIDRRDPHFERHTEFFRNCGMELLENPFPVPRVESAFARALDTLRGLRQAALVLRAARRRPDGPWPRLTASPWAHTLEALRASDLAVIKGGASLYDLGGPAGHLACIRQAFPVSLARALGKKTVSFGQTIGPARGRIGRSLLRRSLDRQDRLYVREELSADLVKDLGCPVECILMPDPAFYLYGSGPPWSGEVSGPALRLGVTARPVSRDRRTQSRFEATLAEAIDRFCTGRAVDVLFLPQVTTPRLFDDDRPVNRRICERLTRCHHKEVLGSEPTVPEIMEQYGQLDLLLATRLHSAILSIVSGTPATVIDYHGHKARGVFRMVGLESLVHTMERLDPVRLGDSLEQLLSTRSDIRRQLEQTLPDLKAQIHRRAGEVVAMAEGNEKR